MAPTGTKVIVNRKIHDVQPLNMKLERDRLSTFSRWPVTFVDKNSVAAAGFYYLNKSDQVQCPYCNLVIGYWEQGDDPLEEHKRWAPLCPFVLTKGSNVRHHGDIRNKQAIRVNDECGPYVYPLEIRPYSGPENGIYKICKPSYPTLANTDARMKSFRAWPKSLKPRPEELSEAGFFYSGQGDQTICHYCGGGMKDWQPEDDPWIEHCKYYPDCSFVIQNKSNEFIQKAVSMKNIDVTIQNMESMAIEDDKTIKMPQEESSPVQLQETVSKTKPAETSLNGLKEGRLCKLCSKDELGVVFLPCGHTVSCVKCASTVNNCPICRKPLAATVRTFLS